VEPCELLATAPPPPPPPPPLLPLGVPGRRGVRRARTWKVTATMVLGLVGRYGRTIGPEKGTTRPRKGRVNCLQCGAPVKWWGKKVAECRR